VAKNFKLIPDISNNAAKPVNRLARRVIQGCTSSAKERVTNERNDNTSILTAHNRVFQYLILPQLILQHGG